MLFPYPVHSRHLFVCPKSSPVGQEVVLQSGFKKAVDFLLHCLSVGAVIAEHQAVDGQTPVHLEGEDGLRLLKGQLAVAHEIDDIPLLAGVRQFPQQFVRHRLIQKQHPVLLAAVDLIAEGIGSALPLRTENVVQGAGGVVHHLREDVVQHIVQIQVAEIEDAPVHLRPLADLRHRHPAEGLFLHQFQQRVPDDLPGVAGPSVQLAALFLSSIKIPFLFLITFWTLFRS